MHDPLDDLPDRIRLPFAFDAGALAADLDALGDETWTRHYVPANYEGEWSVLPLRAPAGETHPLRRIYSDPTAERFEETGLLHRSPYFRAVLGHFRCPLKTARLMRLAPGSEIKEHIDPDVDAETGWARLHIPIRTSARVEFLLGGKRVAMAPGSVWYLRLADPHQVFNRGSEDRVHLVIDAVVNDWLARMLREGAAERSRG